MPAGRPSDYTPAMLKKAAAYLKSVRDDPTEFPMVAALALHLGIARSTIYEWSKHHPEFSDVVDDLMALQEIRLAVNGLSGDYNPTIAKLMLSSKHDYVEKTAQESSGESKVTIEVVSYAEDNPAV